MINLAPYFLKAQKFAIDNSPLILTAVGVTGAVVSSVLTAQTTFKAAEILIRNREIVYGSDETPWTFWQEAKLVWPMYLPSTGMLVLTCGAIIMSHQIGTRRAAALAAAYSLSEKALTEYREKVIEHVGAKKERVYEGEIAQKHVNETPGSSEVIIVSGEVLFLDEFSGRYFNSTVEKVRQAQNDVNAEINEGFYCSLTEFYQKIGLKQTSMSEEVGWNTDRRLEVRFSTTISEDDRPCMVITYAKSPIRDYTKVW